MPNSKGAVAHPLAQVELSGFNYGILNQSAAESFKEAELWARAFLGVATDEPPLLVQARFRSSSDGRRKGGLPVDCVNVVNDAHVCTPRTLAPSHPPLRHLHYLRPSPLSEYVH